MFFIILDGNFDIPDGSMFLISKALRKTEEDSEDETNEISSNQGEEEEEKLACEQVLPFGRAKQASRQGASEGRSREGQRKGELATISYKFSFPPRKPRDSAKHENGHRKRPGDYKSNNRLSS